MSEGRTDMEAARDGWWVPGRVLATSGLVWAANFLIIGPASVADDDSAVEQLHNSQLRVIVRIPQDLVNVYLSPKIEQKAPVNMVVLGAQVSGQARVTGELFIDTQSQFRGNKIGLLFRGTAQATTTSCKGPAVIKSTAHTSFTATKPVYFSNEGTVEAGDARISARSQRQVQAICSTAPGLRGRLVRAVAARRVQRMSPQIDAIAQQQASQRIRTSFDQHVEQLVQQANRSRYVWEPVKDELRRKTGNELQITTTEDHLQLAWLPDDDDQRSLTEVEQRANAMQRTGAASQTRAVTVWISPPLSSDEEKGFRQSAAVLQHVFLLLIQEMHAQEQEMGEPQPGPVHVVSSHEWTYCWVPWQANPTPQPARAK